jgi:uncharacterized membrane protein (UPF0127 family)
VVSKRLRDLEQRTLAGCPRVFVARSVRSRLLGLAWLDDLPEDCGLLLPHCRSVHTFGMRFALDITFLDSEGAVLWIASSVPPRRVLSCRDAMAVLERRADR